MVVSWCGLIKLLERSICRHRVGWLNAIDPVPLRFDQILEKLSHATPAFICNFHSELSDVRVNSQVQLGANGTAQFFRFHQLFLKSVEF